MIRVNILPQEQPKREISPSLTKMSSQTTLHGAASAASAAAAAQARTQVPLDPISVSPYGLSDRVELKSPVPSVSSLSYRPTPETVRFMRSPPRSMELSRGIQKTTKTIQHHNYDINKSCYGRSSSEKEVSISPPLFNAATVQLKESFGGFRVIKKVETHKKKRVPENSSTLAVLPRPRSVPVSAIALPAPTPVTTEILPVHSSVEINKTIDEVRRKAEILTRLPSSSISSSTLLLPPSLTTSSVTDLHSHLSSLQQESIGQTIQKAGNQKPKRAIARPRKGKNAVDSRSAPVSASIMSAPLRNRSDSLTTHDSIDMTIGEVLRKVGKIARRPSRTTSALSNSSSTSSLSSSSCTVLRSVPSPHFGESLDGYWDPPHGAHTMLAPTSPPPPSSTPILANLLSNNPTPLLFDPLPVFTSGEAKLAIDEMLMGNGIESHHLSPSINASIWPSISPCSISSVEEFLKDLNIHDSQNDDCDTLDSFSDDLMFMGEGGANENENLPPPVNSSSSSTWDQTAPQKFPSITSVLPDRMYDW